MRYATYKLYWAAGQQARALRLMGEFARRLEAQEGEGSEVCVFVYVYMSWVLVGSKRAPPILR